MSISADLAGDRSREKRGMIAKCGWVPTDLRVVWGQSPDETN